MLRSPSETLPWRAILNISNGQCHVHQPWSSLGLIRLKSDHHAPDTEPVEQLKEGVKPSRRGTSIFKPRQATFHTKRPSTTSQTLLLRDLRRFRPTRTYWDKAVLQHSEQALVIFATPSFSTWLEDESFVAQLLEAVVPTTATTKAAHKSDYVETKAGSLEPITMDVVCACVDGLPPLIQHFRRSIGHRAKEGFSILQGPTSVLLPNLWDEKDSSTTSSPTMTASLTFVDSKSPRRQSQVVVPLANTLFSNGRHSTLLTSRWTTKEERFVQERSLEKRNQIIGLFTPRTHQSLGDYLFYIPAIPLTPARRIVSGLGNIVKQLDFGGNGVAPASRELEANIDEYLLQTKLEKSTVAVWALIIPKELESQLEGDLSFGLLYEPEAVQARWHDLFPNPDFIGHWISRGARLCRVLSGGGGWGVKQGLLSLDPQSTYSEISDARFDFSTGSLEQQQVSALGNVAEPDAHIQFFVIKKRKMKNFVRSLPSSTKAAGNDVWHLDTVFGTLPSTIDDLPVTLDLEIAKSNDILMQPGHFGALSEAGVFLSAPSKILGGSTKGNKNVSRPAIQTKIDLPYSYIYKDFREQPVERAEITALKPRDIGDRTSSELRLSFGKIEPAKPTIQPVPTRFSNELSPSPRNPEGTDPPIRYYSPLRIRRYAASEDPRATRNNAHKSVHVIQMGTKEQLDQSDHTTQSPLSETLPPPSQKSK